MSKQKSTLPTKRLDKTQLEAFYNKFKSKEKVSSKEISDLADEVHIDHAAMSDVLLLFKGEFIPWLKVWATLLAASAGVFLLFLF